MKHFRLRVLLTVLLAIGFVVAFSWIVAWQNYRQLSGKTSDNEPLPREALDGTLKNLSEVWTEYERRIIKRYEVEAVLASLALENVIGQEDVTGQEDVPENVINQKDVPEDVIGQKDVPEDARENGIVIRIQDGVISPSDPAVRALGLEASLFRKGTGSFAAPNQPATFVAYSRIGNTSAYFVKWYENTVIDDVVRETIDIPGIMKWTELTYDVLALFAACDQDSGAASDLLYKNSRYFPKCESLADLGLTQEDLTKKDADAPGKLEYDETSFSCLAGKSGLPEGYVILLKPVPDLFVKAFTQEGYMIAALIIVLVTLLVGGYSLYPYVRNNNLTTEEEKNYSPSHVRTIASLFGILWMIIIAFCGMFSYALNGMYDDVLRGRNRLNQVEDSFSMYTGRYTRNMQSFREVYLDYGRMIAGFLDVYPELRDTEVLSTLAESIAASSVTLYDSDGRETVSSGRWKGLELGTDPDSTTYDFRRILKGVPSIVHDPEVDEVTGLNEMRLGFQIEDDSSENQYGVMIICVDLSALTNQDVDPERTVRQIFSNLTGADTMLCAADAKNGRVLVSSKEELEGKNISSLGLGEPDLKGSLMKTLSNGDGTFFVTSTSMETPGALEWTKAKKEVILYHIEPKSSVFPGMMMIMLTGCILFLVIYSILSWIILAGYTEEFFDTYKALDGTKHPERKLNRLRRAIRTASPVRKATAAMEILMAFSLLQVVLIVNSDSSAARNTVYHYISNGDWEKGFNLFSIAAIVLLLTNVALLVIGLRLVLAVCASFSGAKGKTIFRLLANVSLYVALIAFLIKAFEYLGFSPATIAAGLGSVALAISLGAQSFVADIFAGLTFLFEGTVHVGDYVRLAVRGSPEVIGKIVEVGIRSIKVLTSEGDFITCSNRDITSVRNSTQTNSRIICRLVISSEYSVEDLEQMLKTELPRVGETDRHILSGPIYNGVTAIGNGTMTLSVSAECSEEDYSYVKDRLNVALLQIFREHGYRL